MKNRILLIAVFTLFANLTSFGQTLKLQDLCNLMNTLCPMDRGAAGKLSSVQYKDGDVVFNLDIADDLIMNFDVIKDNPDHAKKIVLQNFAYSKDGKAPLIDLILKENAGFVFNYKDVTTGKTFTLKLSAKEINDAINSDETADPMELLEEQVKLMSLQLPQKIDTGMVMTKFSLEDGYLVYTCEVDEDLYSIEEIEENLYIMKLLMKEELLSGNDPIVARMLEICKDANMGIAYKYVGNKTKKSAVIKFSASEL